MKKKPWERRLKDLSHLLNVCAQTYFDPELFRLNLNQFLQTSRTVTFIIQKNKHEIDGYEGWYSLNIIDKWKNDPIMTWAKNSRNAIEKQGDLEMSSTAKATLLFSYIEEQDIEITTTDKLVSIGVKQLVRIAQKHLPSGVNDAAVIKSERRWVANTLNNYELLHALTTIYSRIYDCCESLGELVGVSIGDDITLPTSFHSLHDEIRHVSYLKLRNLSVGKISYNTVSFDSENIPENIIERLKSVDQREDINSTEGLVGFYAKMAEAVFIGDGYHNPILIFFNKEYQPCCILSTSFDDQADKYIFWRFAADRAKLINAYGFVWISELWVRSTQLNKFHNISIRNMPIIDERLQIVGIDADNNMKKISWKIIRESEQSQAILERSSVDNPNEGQAFFMRPVLKAIGGDTSMLNA